MGSMTLENETKVPFNVEASFDDVSGGGGGKFQKFMLYETRSNFYMFGFERRKKYWKVLKISRSDQTELIVVEDSTLYSQDEQSELLQRIADGNKSTGGLKFVTTCYGIVGFIKFLGPYYMIIITKRKKIGTICGHAVYSVAKSEMIPVPYCSANSNMAYSKSENRYKKLLRNVDLTKDFFFSYSYHVMLSLQRNLSKHETGLSLYETMFVWNEFLTRGIRNQLRNSVWTVALVYGFFKQVKLSVSGHDFSLILIARRSRHYAGTRYLKRGVNEKGRVANDVETEQIVLEDVVGRPRQISSVVQNRGSIPLFWSQETSRLNIKPDIILSKKDDAYQATRLHFENLAKRYGNPIIILNLIKTREKKPRESILRAEFAHAIEVINKDLAHENRLKFLHWDLSKHSRNKAACVLAYLVKVAANALDLTGFFYCELPPVSSQLPCSSDCNDDCPDEDLFLMNEDVHDMNAEDRIGSDVNDCHVVKLPLFQKGVLRTNCIDCLDRTNVAQYVYGLVALGHQLHALGYINSPSIGLDSSLADDLMKIYEAMGDTLALQYGGSAAHNKIFSERRGQWKAATQSQEFLRTLQRFYSNAYMDAEKQDAINVFLGHFQPQQGKPALWELDSDQHYSVGKRGSEFAAENARSMIKRSFSDGNILCDNSANVDEKVLQMNSSQRPLAMEVQDCGVCLSESTPEFSTCETAITYSRYTPSMSRKQLFLDAQQEQVLENESTYFVDRRDLINCSNFLDVDCLSSSGNSCEEETYERSLLIASPNVVMSSGEIKMASTPCHESGSSLKGKELVSGNLGCGSASSSVDLTGFSDSFVHWVINGNVLFP
ncbi:phosphoinositide phosphatase SAC2-like [Salvia splendens]|uniref:phosphoinositide phosphatase SAC2-like n=1 Tax=Salvia splendens TaxID=180675 RepID=UPI001C258EDB|nr:phosphoinositide phosphatase SAC2-like [Salvia splendens]XP_042048112.1 phosphoinositide phosphatase SAC2-like [Salvia splendens]